MARKSFSKTDASIISQWWWKIDRWTFGAVIFLLSIGILLIFAASPGVAERIGLSSYYFLQRHLMYLLPGIVTLCGISMLSVRNIRRFALLLFFASILMIIVTLVAGDEIKGARRWVNLAGISLQPSEFLKPALAVLSAWMFSEQRLHPDFPGMTVASFLFALSVVLLLMQPDLGMVVLISVTWFSQLFLAGLSILWVITALGAGILGLGFSYLFLPHVTRRIDQFLSGSDDGKFSDRYQITQSLESFISGGFFGKGPGEGVIKKSLPDAHADFVFAVAAEEFGMILCLLVVIVFIFMVIRTFYKTTNETNLFIIIASSGLMIQFGLQAMINIMSTLSLIPTKGMTLPFISFGGSSLLSVCILMGMVIGLTKERPYGHEL